MKSTTSESLNENQLRQWIKELTDYTPQQIDQVLEQLQERYKVA